MRYIKEIEFMQLEQGNLSIIDYAIQTSGKTMNEGWRCRKFEFGLRQELKEVVVPMSTRDFLTLVEKVKVEN